MKLMKLMWARFKLWSGWIAQFVIGIPVAAVLLPIALIERDSPNSFSVRTAQKVNHFMFDHIPWIRDRKAFLWDISYLKR